jgi:hypothetical protein
MHIGYEDNTGHVYEGGGRPEFAVVPAPMLTQATLIETPEGIKRLPEGHAPLAWVFREESFDPVTRIRRGRLYEPYPGGQPDLNCLTRGHPANQASVVSLTRGETLTKTLFHYWQCQTLLNKPRAGQGLSLAFGDARSWSLWRIVQVERVIGDDVLVTLKALSAFGILPELRHEAIPEEHQGPIQRAIDRVLDAAFRESAISAIDQCRNAAVALIGRWLVSNGAESKVLGDDLGALVKRVREEPYRCGAVAGVGEMIARLHPRGKANEQETKGYRLAQEEDAEASVHAIGFILREFGWARA